jgi:CxxC motif-containing protein (DUF1111 family)
VGSNVRESEVMDEGDVRRHAEAHARAMVDGDLRRAASDLTPEAQKEAGSVMKKMPDPVTGAQIQDVVVLGDAAVARIFYAGGDTQLVVESHWENRDGRPMIVSLTTG